MNKSGRTMRSNRMGNAMVISLASEIQEIELAIISTGLARPRKQVRTIDDSRCYTNSYDVFTNPEAIQYIKSGDMLMLYPYKRHRVDFSYDFRLSNPKGIIDLLESAINDIECSLWACRKRIHPEYQQYYPPLASDYHPRCRICGAFMEVALGPIVDRFRDKLENLTEYVEVSNVHQQEKENQIAESTVTRLASGRGI